MIDLRSMRISLKFSEKDADHVAVAKLLKQLGRKKSSFIVKAVKYYIENNPAPDVPGTNAVVTSMVTEAVVRSTIMKMLKSGEIPSNFSSMVKFEIPQTMEVSEGQETEKTKKVEKLTSQSKSDKQKAKNIRKIETKKIPEEKEELSEDDYVSSDEEKKNKEDTAAVEDMLSMLDEF